MAPHGEEGEGTLVDNNNDNNNVNNNNNEADNGRFHRMVDYKLKIETYNFIQNVFSRMCFSTIEIGRLDDEIHL